MLCIPRAPKVALAPMAANTKIEWCDHTFNPWVGCTKVSPACDHCYAEAWAKRTGHPELWAPGSKGTRRRTTPANWRQPLVWQRKRKAFGLGWRPRVFCASLADVFDNQVPAAWRDDLWALIAETPSLDWLLLTKRPQNIRKMLPGSCVEQLVGCDLPPWPWSNVWLGTTVENEWEAVRRLPYLLDAQARVRFLSMEPLLEPINLARAVEAAGGTFWPQPGRSPDLHWVIVGGETGGGARPMDPSWARAIQIQCQVAGIPFFLKQMTRKAPIPELLMVREFPEMRP